VNLECFRIVNEAALTPISPPARAQILWADILLTPLEATPSVVEHQGYATGLGLCFTRLWREGGVRDLYAVVHSHLVQVRALLLSSPFLFHQLTSYTSPSPFRQIPYAIGQSQQRAVP